jgi:predicted nucleic acid-binding protein
MTPAVHSEILEAIEQGCVWLQGVLVLVESERLQLVALTREELLATSALPDSLGPGERESVAVCQARTWVFLTNDKRARNYCQGIHVEVYDLAGLLRALWESGLRSKRFVRRLIVWKPLKVWSLRTRKPSSVSDMVPPGNIGDLNPEVLIVLHQC